MNRKDFIKAFSAGTTLAAATSLADIVEAKPVIHNTLFFFLKGHQKISYFEVSVN